MLIGTLVHLAAVEMQYGAKIVYVQRSPTYVFKDNNKRKYVDELRISLQRKLINNVKIN